MVNRRLGLLLRLKSSLPACPQMAVGKVLCHLVEVLKSRHEGVNSIFSVASND